MAPGVGELFIAEADREAWRRPLVRWAVAGVVVGVAALVPLVTGWVHRGVAAAVLGLALVVVLGKAGGYVGRRKRRVNPLMIDLDGVRLPTGQGPVSLPWDAVRAVVVDGPTLRFRVRPSVTPGTPGVAGMHRRDAWPVASGPGLPLDTRLYRRGLEEILDAVRTFSGDSVRITRP
ncbi:hypothetical protein V5P93_003392 [Actinokineospora auranticolor]|uniref:PH (Pleckstrin Homology) domain-containing protein n=1 Tax=Actinokineospora auranticolor TaxID=155976 RepID=A0A2S6GPG0_9PSEU|nr:hypothetical protein [Actinokineospora auranticolor]PPK67053.1 hypothetical protein CLV40_10850 [Actinokineospora auranticolor]